MDPTTKLTDHQAGRLAQLTLNQQINAVDLERIARDMQLRQWCVEQVIAFVAASQCEPTENPEITSKRLYDFVTAPLRDQQ